MAPGVLKGFIRRSVVWFFNESLPASALLIVCGTLMWVFFGFNRHMLPMVHGEMGDYGRLELAEVLSSRTKIIEFSAIRVPSRIAWKFILLPEEIAVTIRYRTADGIERLWDSSYIVSCDSKGYCASVNHLRGIVLMSLNGEGHLQERGWVYFREARPLPELAVPGPPPVQPFHYRLPNGTLLVRAPVPPVDKAGRFFICTVVK